jgi:hypothetical protein
LIECLDGICIAEGTLRQIRLYQGMAASHIASDLNVLYNDMGLIYDGANRGVFDVQAVYDRAGISALAQNSMNEVINGLGAQKQGAVNAVNNSIDAIKTYQKAAGGVLDGIF